MHDGNIRNYSVFLKDDLLFAYFEYVGDDLNADYVKIVDHPKMQEWWAIMTPMQEPLPTRVRRVVGQHGRSLPHGLNITRPTGRSVRGYRTHPGPADRSHTRARG